MELFFSVSKHYINNYGDEPEINEYCESICEIASKKEYSTKVNRINVIPIILPEESISNRVGKEYTRIELRYNVVLITRRINFDIYHNATIEGKKKILFEFLLRTLGEIQKKIRFDLETFKEDVSHLE